MSLSKIEDNYVKRASSSEEVKIGSFWENNTVIIFFFRRFGCMFCRQAAKELSTLKPLLEFGNRNIRLVGIGLEEIGLEEFQKGEFFTGELFIDLKKQTYKTLGFRRLGLFKIFRAILSKPSRPPLIKALNEGATGDMKGDNHQLGGALIVGKGGELLLEFVQENPALHLQQAEILKALDIPYSELEIQQQKADQEEYQITEIDSEDENGEPIRVDI